MFTLDNMLAQPFQFALVCRDDNRLAAIVSLLMRYALPFSVSRTDTADALRFSDLDDIRNSQNGDGDAYRRLIERHQATVGKLMWRFSRDPGEHEELVQQVFVEAWLGLGRFRAEAPFAHWLARIATRVGYRYWNRSHHRKAAWLPDEEWDRLAESTGDAIDTGQAAELVHRLLAQLPPRDRLVLTMRYLEQCDVAQTAYRLGWTQARVKVQTHRALARLKKLTANTSIELEL
jgi:RNA polymerase sigma-70 factor (ECF subfamily)